MTEFTDIGRGGLRPRPPGEWGISPPTPPAPRTEPPSPARRGPRRGAAPRRTGGTRGRRHAACIGVARTARARADDRSGENIPNAYDPAHRPAFPIPTLDSDPAVAAPFSRTTRAIAADGPRAAWLLWALAGAMLAGWAAWFGLARVAVLEVSTRARVEVQRAAHPVAAPIAGRVARHALAIDQRVQAGDVLLELDAEAARLRLREEQARLAALAPRIESLRREAGLVGQAGAREREAAVAAAQGARHRLDETRASLEFARDQARRLQAESEAGGVSRSEAARAHSEAQRLAAAGDAIGAEVRRLESEAGTRAQQRQAAIEALARTAVELEGEAATVRASIARIEQDIARHVVRAPVAGRIGEVGPLRAGGWAAEGQAVASVVPDGDFVIVADYAPAAAFGRIHAGQRARMRLDGFPWAQFGVIDARVVRVGNEIRDGLVRVELAPGDAPSRGPALQHGLPGAIEVIVDEAPPAVLLLRAAGQALSRPAFVADAGRGAPR